MPGILTYNLNMTGAQVAAALAGGVPAAESNLLINGNFAINQRGLSQYPSLSNSEPTYTVDGFFIPPDNTDTTLAIDGYHRMTISSVGSGIGKVVQNIEEADTQSLWGQVVTLSALVESSTNNGGSLVISYLHNGQYTTASQAIVITAPLQVISVSTTIPQTATHLSVELMGSVGVGNTLFENVKLEVSPVPTRFVSLKYAENLAQCQRYQLLLSGSLAMQFAMSATHREFLVVTPTEMLRLPTIEGEFTLLPSTGGTPLSGAPYTPQEVSGNRMIISSTGSGSTIVYLATSGNVILNANLQF